MIFPNLGWVAVSLAPYVIVLLWGAWLSVRRRNSRPHAFRWCFAALGLIVFGALVQNFLLEVLPRGFQLLIGESPLLQWALIGLLRLPDALAVGCLFWAALGDSPPDEADPDDDAPPVFRYDDGSVAPTR